MNWQDEQPKQPLSRLWLYFALSVVAHVIVLVLHFNPFEGGENRFEDKTPIEVTQIPIEKVEQMMRQGEQQSRPKVKIPENEKQIAESEKADNEKLDPNAKYLSDKNQTAEKQTKAKNIDDFRDKKDDGKDKGKQASAEPPPTGNPDSFDEAPSDLDVADSKALVPDAKNNGIKRDWKNLSLKDLGLGGTGQSAATDDRLKGLDESDRTILSTREFKYFSYYHRIKELLRQHWKPNVERRLTRLYGKGRNVSENEMITRLQVMLTPEGRITKISRVHSSGFEEIDEAAVEAFNRAGPFPNPPKGMLESDGFVRINWDFVLNIESAPRIQFSNAGRPMP